MPRSARMSNHASAGGTVARTGQRSCNDAVATLSPKARDSERDLIPSNIYKQGALDAADFAQRQRQAVLTRIGAQALQHQRRANRSGAHRGGQPEHVIPVRGDQFFVDRAGDERRERRPIAGRAEGIEPTLGQIRNARREREAEQKRQGEDVIADAAAVGVVRANAQVGLVVEQSIDHMRGFAGGRDGNRVEGRMARRRGVYRTAPMLSRP